MLNINVLLKLTNSKGTRDTVGKNVPLLPRMGETIHVAGVQYKVVEIQYEFGIGNIIDNNNQIQSFYRRIEIHATEIGY